MSALALQKTSRKPLPQQAQLACFLPSLFGALATLLPSTRVLWPSLSLSRDLSRAEPSETSVVLGPLKFTQRRLGGPVHLKFVLWHSLEGLSSRIRAVLCQPGRAGPMGSKQLGQHL